MHQIELTGSSRLRLAQQRRPAEPLGADEVEGLAEFSLVSPGTELQSYRGDDPTPRGTGYAVVFRVTATGRDVADLAPDDLVFAMGRHARFQRFARREVLRVPNGLAPEAAVFARLMSVSWTTLATTRARPASKVLITGLGIVGNLAAQIFAGAGYQVCAVDPVAARRSLAETVGIANVAPVLADLKEETGFRLVVECSGHEGATLDACRGVEAGGEVVLVGVPWRQRTDDSAHELLHLIFHRYVTVRSGWEWELPRHRQGFSVGSIDESLEGALSWLAAGRVEVDGLADIVTPDQAPRVYAELAESKTLTAVFDWRDDD